MTVDRARHVVDEQIDDAVADIESALMALKRAISEKRQSQQPGARSSGGETRK